MTKLWRTFSVIVFSVCSAIIIIVGGWRISNEELIDEPMYVVSPIGFALISIFIACIIPFYAADCVIKKILRMDQSRKLWYEKWVENQMDKLKDVSPDKILCAMKEKINDRELYIYYKYVLKVMLAYSKFRDIEDYQKETIDEVRKEMERRYEDQLILKLAKVK